MIRTLTLLALLTCLALRGVPTPAEEAAPTAPAISHVSISGEVHTPDRYEVSASTTINQLVTQAGGANEMAGDSVYLTHTDASGNVRHYSINLKDPRRADAAGWLRDGDTVVVPRAGQISVTGEVNKPGTYRLDAGMTVLQAIQKAGDVTVFGSHKTAVIRRKDTNGAEQTLKANPDDDLEPDDEVRVKISYF